MSIRTLTRRLWVLATVAFFCPAVASAAPSRYIPDQIIVKYKADAPATARAAVRAAVGGARLEDMPIIRGELVSVRGMSVERAIQLAKRNPHVEYAEPDWEIKLDLTPNDPRFPELYAMRNTGQTGGTPGADIRAVNAWDLFTGSSNVLVGVIDTGVDYTHPDLAANAWTNPGEIPGNNIDDDGNGFIDDVHGYDFVNNDGNPMDDNGHGTHVAGTIGAVGNNSVGVVGVNWNVKIAAIKFLSAGGSGSTANAILSVQYAVTIGVDLTNNSWGGGSFSQALLDAINAAGAAGQLFVAAAGNSGVNTDATPHYPSSYTSAHIISVAATDHNDALAVFTVGSSNYGLTSVDLGAPGKNILSTVPGGSYSSSYSGTSMATPHVAGACAMVWGRFPAMTNLQVKDRVMAFADPIPALAGRCVTGARLNVFMAIADPDSIAPGQVTDLATTNPGSTTMGLTWTATGDDGGTGRASSYELRYSTAPLDSANFEAGTLVPTSNPQPAGSAESIDVGGLAFNTTYYFALKARDEFGNPGPLSNVASGTTLGEPDIRSQPASLASALHTGQQETQTLYLYNDNEGTLDFTIPTPEIILGTFELPALQKAYPVLEIGKGGFDPRAGDPVLAASGGPDAFGYRWVDSDEVGGPVFAWVDITAVGTPIAFTADDQNLGGIPIGFDFPFYGNTFNTLRACTNGWLSFTSSLTSFTNQPLPTGGTSNPENLLAPFWDDLDFRSTSGAGRAYYHNDGTRLIVSYHNVPHWATAEPRGGPYTFQVILYPSGEIRYQYRSMSPPLDSATIGIQNATRDVGLQVVFNALYVHDNLAIRIAPLQQWLTVTPSSGRILAGDSTAVQVTFDATGLMGGTYNGNIHVVSNDPDENPYTVPCVLDVTGAADIAASGDLAYGEVFLGAAPGRNLQVANNGTDDLVVANVACSVPVLTASPASFTLAPGGSQTVVVTYAPVAEGTLAATVTIHCNDPDQATVVFAATGTALVGPDISVGAGSMGAYMLPNESETKLLRVHNRNLATQAALTYSAGASVDKVAGGPSQPVLDLGKDSADPRRGEPMLAASGGPDAFGYRWKDSDETGGPAFSWADITGVGTPVGFTGDDQTIAGIPIGFTFPFYGNNFATLNACTNGWVSFTSTATSYLNQPLPTGGTTDPNNLIALFWDDLDFRATSGAGQAFYHNDGTRFILSYINVPHYPTSGSGTYTFQLILYPSGKILIQYRTMVGLLTSATVGTQNAARDVGLQVVFNAAYVHDNMAVRIQKRPEWLSVTPAAGTVPGAGHADLDVTFNSTDLEPGTYTGNIRISSNDPDEATVDIPVTLVVGGPTDVTAPLPKSFGLALAGSNPAAGAARLMLSIPRSETVDVRVYNVRGAVVRRLVHAVREPGFHAIAWDGRDDSGRTVGSGIYFVRMRAGHAVEQTVRVTLVR